MKNSKKTEFAKAFQIGSVCVGSYMVSYYMRNVLSVTTPEMLGGGVFTKEFIGTLSSVYMLAYAVGQLLNGVVGDMVKPKWMITIGTVLSGLASILFSFTSIGIIQIALFATIGFSLSMLRGPLVKTISENTNANHSRVICTFFSFAGFAGPLIASLISMFFDWRKTFVVAGGIALAIGIMVYLIFSAFERKGYVTYTLSRNSQGFKNVFKIFGLRHFVFFLFVGGLAEISSASINFWIPTYFTEELCLSENVSKTIYSAMSFVKGIVPFLTLFIFNACKKKDIVIIRFSYVLAVLFFGIMLFRGYGPYVNIVSLLMAQMAIGVTSSLLWSIYIASQRESGMVSTINGVLDFSGYLFASGANIVFAHTIEKLSWNGIIVLWISMAAAGFVVSILTKQDNNIE